MAATYAYLTEAEGLLFDIATILADILLDIVHDMLDETKLLHQLYNMLSPANQAIVDLINQLGMATLQPLINGLLAQEVNVTQIIGKPGASIV